MSSNYWVNRAARQMHSQMQKAEDYAKDLAKYYIAASRHLQSEQNAILRRFALTHHMTIKEAEELISSLKDPSSIKELIKALKKDPKNAELVKEFEAQAARSRIMRLNALQSQVTYTAGQIQVLLNKKAQKLFVNLARSAYYNTMFDAMQRAGYGFNVKMLDPKRIKRVMDRSWAGSGFSKRLWGNTKALEDAVKREIMVNLLTGRPLIKASQAINEEFGKGYNNARRLIRTESAYITNQMTLEGYKDLEADKYIYVAVLDLKTSEVCRRLDKKRFLVKSAKVGVNYPPMHPWCRSTTIPWMPDSLLKNMKQRALDPKTGKHVLVPGDMTYEEWYKQFVQGQPAGDSTTQQQNLTRDQYDRYKDRLGDDFDYTYDEFLKAKGNPQIWADLQQKYKDARQYEDYKALMGDKLPDSLEKFRDLKYNNIKEWERLQRAKEFYKKVDSNNWSDEFKQKARDAYREFWDHDIEMSYHAIARFCDRKAGSRGRQFEMEDIVSIMGKKPNYMQQDGRLIRHYDDLAIIQEPDTGEIRTIVVRKTPKGDWEDA